MKRCRNEVQGKRTGMKWKRIAGTALLGLFCLMTAVGPARAEEPGQQEAQQPAAQEIVGNKWYSGTTNDTAENDVYTYTVEDSSYFSLIVYQTGNRTTEYLSVNAYCQKPWSDERVQLEDTNEGVLITNTATGKGQTGLYCFPKGSIITIELNAMGGSLAPTATPYKLKIQVKHVRDSYFEKEENQKKANATKVPFERLVGGILNVEAANLNGVKPYQSYKQDVDWFVMTAPKAGNYRVRAALVQKYDGVKYTVYNKKGKMLLKGTAGKGKQKASDKTIKLKKGEKIYIKFSGPTGFNVNGWKYEFKVTRQNK